MAILIAVISVVVGEIGDLQRQGLEFLSTKSHYLIWGILVDYTLVSVAALGSLLRLLGAVTWMRSFLVPFGLGVLLMAIGVPAWVVVALG
jgi:hypothetical protein